MTNQEAIKGLNNLFSEYELTLPCTDSLEILHMAVAALEKQIQKKPILTPNCAGCKKESCTDCLSDEYSPDTTLCPNCKEVVQNRDNGDAYTDNFCPNCGQALDWGENSKD